MNGKMKVFRYLIWFLYTLMTGTLLAGLISVFCVREGLAAYWGILIGALYAAGAGVCVFLIHRAELGASPAGKYRILLWVLEAAAVIVFVGLGLRLRIEGVDSAKEWMIYYEMVQAAEGQEIPRTAHGAVNVYLWLLHFVLTFFGNQFAAGIWLQILLQTAALLGLYFILRKLAGVIAALTMLVFGMCAPYMVQNALMLSPEMLYFCFLTAVTALTAAAYGGKLKTLLFLLIGILAGLCVYLDVIGVLLFLPAAAAVFRRREEAAGTAKKSAAAKKAAAGLLCAAGGGAGFLGCVILEIVLGGRTMQETVQAWLMLYRPEGFQVPAVMGGACSELEGAVLLGLMIFGVFSFWCNPRKERITMWMPAVMGIMLAACFGVFTYEMPGYFYLYVLFVVLAGIGVGQCFYSMPPEPEGGSADGLTVELQKNGGGGSESAADGPREAGKQPESAAGGRKEAEKRPESAADGPREAGKQPESAAVGRKEAEKQPESAAGESRDAGEEAKAAKRLWNELGKLGVSDGDMKEIGFEEIEAEEKSKKQIKFIENPLPLPKKHVKRVLDYPLEPTSAKEDFDHPTAADDDFDI